MAKGLKADLSGLWRYRVGNDRILCQIKNGEPLVLVVVVHTAGMFTRKEQLA